MNNEWIFPQTNAPQTSYAVTRGFQSLQALGSAAALGVAANLGIRLVQRWGYFKGEVLTLRTALVFFVVSAAIKELGDLLLEVSQALLGERKTFENLEITASTTTSHKLRRYSWKVIAAIEYIPYQIDRLFSKAVGIRTLRELEASNSPPRDLRFLEIVRKAFLAQIVTSSVTFATHESGLYAGNYLRYDLSLIRQYIGQYKLWFGLGVLMGIATTYTEKMSDQSAHDHNLRMTAGKECLTALRGSLDADLRRRLSLVMTESEADIATQAELLSAAITMYASGSKRGDSLDTLTFLSEQTRAYIGELRTSGSADLDQTRIRGFIAPDAPNSLFLVECVKDVFGFDAGVTAIRAATSGSSTVKELLRERNRPALILVLAELIGSYGIAHTEVPVPSFFPKSALEMIIGYRSGNEEAVREKPIFVAKCQSLSQHIQAKTQPLPEDVREFMGRIDAILNEADSPLFIRCVERIFNKEAGAVFAERLT